jgi:hypothetical protein
MSDDDNCKFNKTMDAHYASLGKVASAWSEFEHVIQWAIWSLAGLDNLTGACITIQIGTSSRMMDAIIALLRLRGAPENAITPLQKFATEVADMQRKRNRIVHDPWSFRLPSAQPYRMEMTAQKKLVSDLIPHSTTEVVGFLDKISALPGQFDALLSAVPLSPLPAAQP